MRRDSKVSVIITAFNARRFLASAVQSVVTQTHHHNECIIVDDGSTDETWEIAQDWARRDPRIRPVRRQNGGLCRARNTGIGAIAADSAAVVFLDYDDELEPHALEILRTAIAQRGIIGSHATAVMMDAAGHIDTQNDFAGWLARREAIQAGKIVRLGPGRPTGFHSFVLRCNFPPCTYMIRREIVDRLAGFDPGMNGAEDWDYWIRASRFGAFAFRPDVIARYRRHDSNATLDCERIHRAVNLVRAKTFWAPENTPEQALVVRASYRCFHQRRIREHFQGLVRDVKQRKLVAGAKRIARIVLHACCLLGGSPRRIQPASSRI